MIIVLCTKLLAKHGKAGINCQIFTSSFMCYHRMGLITGLQTSMTRRMVLVELDLLIPPSRTHKYTTMFCAWDSCYSLTFLFCVVFFRPLFVYVLFVRSMCWLSFESCLLITVLVSILKTTCKFKFKNESKSWIRSERKPRLSGKLIYCRIIGLAQHIVVFKITVLKGGYGVLRPCQQYFSYVVEIRFFGG